MPRRHIPLLFLNVFIIAICGLVYELLAGAVASYLLGDSITQFSLVIGLYLSAMGVGAWLSRFVDVGVGRRFIEVQLAIAVVGGSSAPLLFLIYGLSPSFKAVLWLEVLLIGALVGLELPLLDAHLGARAGVQRAGVTCVGGGLHRRAGGLAALSAGVRSAAWPGAHGAADGARQRRGRCLGPPRCCATC